MEEASYLSDLNCSNPTGIVKLNVGGCKFTTTVATLTCVAGSYFDALFSGRWKQHLTEVRSAGVACRFVHGIHAYRSLNTRASCLCCECTASQQQQHTCICIYVIVLQCSLQAHSMPRANFI